MIIINDREIKFEKFPNGETRMVEDSFPSQIIKDTVLNVKFKYEDDSDLIKLMFVKKYLEQTYSMKDINACVLEIMYMPYSRMDRSVNGSAFTLKYVTEFINSLNFDAVSIIEPHSDVTVALIDSAFPNMHNLQLIKEVKSIVGFEDEVDYIVFPDGGACKRYSDLKAENLLIGHKNRDFKTGEIKGLSIIGDTNGVGKKAIIVDDLSSYGGTFIATSKELRKLGIEKVYLLVAHAENSIFKGELFNHVDGVFTTNSILTEQDNWENQRFKDKLHIFNVLN